MDLRAVGAPDVDAELASRLADLDRRRAIRLGVDPLISLRRNRHPRRSRAACFPPGPKRLLLQLPGQILHPLLEIAGEVASARCESGGKAGPRAGPETGSRSGSFGQGHFVIGRIGLRESHLDLPLPSATKDRQRHRARLAELEERGELIGVADDLVVEAGEDVKAFQACGGGGGAPRLDRVDKQADPVGEVDLLADGGGNRRERGAKTARGCGRAGPVGRPIVGGGAAWLIPVVGYVGAGAQIFSIDDHEKGAGLEEVDAPIPGLPHSTVAVRVRGRSMEPAFYPGDLIFYDRQDSGDFTHLIGKECIVRLGDGRTFIKILKRLPDGSWYLHSNNDEPIIGIDIEWAAKVKLIVRA